MTSRSDIFTTVVVPVASEADARTTVRAAAPHLSEDARLVVVHVIEKAGGAPDKASVEQREGRAEDVFDAARETASSADVDLETRVAYGTDVAGAVFDVADEVEATAVAFSSREGRRWVKLLTGDVALDLVTEADRPVVVLPEKPEG